MKRASVTKRRSLFVGIFALALLAGSFLAIWVVRVHKSDIATAKRLYGKWDVYSSATPDNPKPYAIFEWLPNGRMDCYTLDGFAIYSNQLNVESKWWVRNGSVRHQIKIDKAKGIIDDVPEGIHVDSTSRFQIEWINQDSFRMHETTNGSEGHPMLLRRRNPNRHEGLQQDEPSDAPESANRGVSKMEDQPRGPGDR